LGLALDGDIRNSGATCVVTTGAPSRSKSMEEEDDPDEEGWAPPACSSPSRRVLLELGLVRGVDRPDDSQGWVGCVDRDARCKLCGGTTPVWAAESDR
jgi:hypothetical protein